MYSKLSPSVDLEQLLERSEPTGKRYEAIRELGHQRFPLMHRVHNPQLSQPMMRHLVPHHPFGNDTDHLTATSENLVRQSTHHTHARPTIDKSNTFAHQHSRQISRSVRVAVSCTGTRATENAKRFHSTKLIVATSRNLQRVEGLILCPRA